MNIKDKMVRREMQDVIEIGEILNRFYNGQAGEIFRAIVNEIILDNVSQDSDVITNADRRLGRCEGAQKVRSYIELAIQEMEKLKEPIGAESLQD
jgi:hypothetical protein